MNKNIPDAYDYDDPIDKDQVIAQRDEQKQDKKCKGCDCINLFYEDNGCSFECFNDKLKIECSHPTECFCDLRTPSLYKNYIKNKDNNCDMCEHFTDEEHYQIHFCIECENEYNQEVCCMSGKRSIENYHPEGVSNDG